MKWFIYAVKNYAKFSGRARRKEYWMYMLFYFLFYAVALGLDAAFGFANPVTGVGIIAQLFSLALLVPSWAVLVRRLHDIGKSGWMVLIALIPIIGAIWLFVLLAKDSEMDENKYGANPKC